MIMSSFDATAVNHCDSKLRGADLPLLDCEVAYARSICSFTGTTRAGPIAMPLVNAPDLSTLTDHRLISRSCGQRRVM